jgi:glycosyltransferase involved in cell wall biosynthesis
VKTDNPAKGAILATSSPLGEEAIGKVALHLAEGLAKSGFLNRLLYISGRPLPESDRKSERVAPRRIPLVGRFGWGRKYLQEKQGRQYQSEVAGAIEKHDPGLFYGWILQSRQPLETCRRLDIRSALECGSIHPVAFKEILTREFKRHDIPLPWHMSDSRIRESLHELGLADNIVAPSPLVKESFISRGFDPEKIIVMPPGVDCEFFQPEPKPQSNIQATLYVGRLELAKGVHHLMTAWQKAKGSSRRLILVGNIHPCLKRWLELHPEVVDESVEFAGIQIDLRPYFNKASFSVLPSLADGFGMAVMEGMAAGLPAIVTDNCGVKMAVRDGENGWVVPAGDVDALAERMEQAFADAGRIAEMAQNARSEAEKYDWGIFEHNASILKDLYLK